MATIVCMCCFLVGKTPAEPTSSSSGSGKTRASSASLKRAQKGQTRKFTRLLICMKNCCHNTCDNLHFCNNWRYLSWNIVFECSYESRSSSKSRLEQKKRRGVLLAISLTKFTFVDKIPESSVHRLRCAYYATLLTLTYVFFRQTGTQQ